MNQGRRLAFVPYNPRRSRPRGQLAGFGIGDVFDGIGDVFHSVVGAFDDVFGGALHIVERAFPAIAAVGGFIYGGPMGAVKGFTLGKTFFDAQNAKERGKDAQKEYMRAAECANYLASAGIDISGKDPDANALIAALADDDYDYESVEAQDAIRQLVAQKTAAAQTSQKLVTWGGVALGAVALYLLARART